MKKLMIIASAFLLVCGVVGTASAVPVQWADNGHYYEVVLQPELGFWGANAWADLADNDGFTDGTLAKVTSAAEWSFIQSLDDFGSNLWLGGYQNWDSGGTDVGWNWVTGETWSLTAWAGGEPNDSGGIGFWFWVPNLEDNGENLLETWAGGSGWNDSGLGTQGFIVEYENVPVPEPATMLLLGTGLVGLAGAGRKKFFKK